MCGNNIVAFPSKVSLATALVDPEEILQNGYLVELFSGVSQKEQEDGYWSMFSDPGIVNDVIFDNGAVVIDFNDQFIQHFGKASSATVTFWMMEQICRTLFQFTEVKSVTLTLNGSCEAIGDILQTGCLKTERDMWEFSVKENGWDLPTYYSLEGR